MLKPSNNQIPDRNAPRPPPPPRVRTMTLANVRQGKIAQPPKVLIYGAEGCGKSTFGANAPDPIFLCAEDGTAQLDVARFPEPKGWLDVLDAVDELTTTEHAYRTLVVDSLDWLEPLCWDYIVRRDKKTGIEDYGFSKGQKTIAPAEWRVFLSKLERLRNVKNMGVVLIAHQHVKSFKNPEGDDFDRYELAMDAKAGGMFKQWCDAVLFAQFETFATKDERKRVRGVSSGARIVHTQRTAAFDAKNRYDLPERMPLDWHSFMEGVEAAAPATPERLRLKIHTLLSQVTDQELTDKVVASVQRFGEDAAQLAKIYDRLAARVAIASQENEDQAVQTQGDDQ